jgi:hypoxanthine phosphoribosyltransferase
VHKDIHKVLYSTEAIAARVHEMGQEIAGVYGDQTIHVICILKGAFPFMADLVRAIPGHVTCDFMAVSSYGSSTKSSGAVRIVKDLQKDPAGRHVLIVEDIVDTGLTLKFLRSHIAAHEPGTMRVASLLSKPSQRKVEVPIDFCGFEVPDEFVVGYGLDFDELYRNLPYIGVLHPDAYGG